LQSCPLNRPVAGICREIFDLSAVKYVGGRGQQDQIEHASVSGHHAVLNSTPGLYHQGSRFDNGTRINGERISEQKLGATTSCALQYRIAL